MTIVTPEVLSVERCVRLHDPSAEVGQYGNEWIVEGDYEAGEDVGIYEWHVWAPSEQEAWFKAHERLFGASA